MLLQTNISQPIIGILGLPRSGTTILSNLLNSCDNGFCVVEPIWATESGVQAKSFNTSKTGAFNTVPSSEIPSRLREIVYSKPYSFGAIKETYRQHQLFCVNPLERCDIIIATFRDPVANFSSWKRSGWGGEYNSVDFFIQNYLYYNRKLSLLAAKRTPIIKMIHEDFCVGKIAYFNDKFQQQGRIVGDCQLKGVESPYHMGDGKAATSSSIENVNSDKSLVSAAEKSKISRCLNPLYTSMKCMFLAALCYLIFSTKTIKNSIYADLNQDGRLDMISIENKSMNVYIGTKSGGFEYQAKYDLANVPINIVGDVNNDGFADITFINKGTKTVMYGNGDGSFKPETIAKD